ncbi:hypothetical protein [Rhabdochlamydiaceae symbiont of Dictyostelium giganteum]|uniref:hypothetical protein n=1 Tax=Rhabdochlamydiaceae symbiont of Dictyostelium giganteum TaxID=3342349 RepID=UPI00384BCCEA
MASFKIINHVNDIHLDPRWTSSTKFNSKYRLVNEMGQKLTSCHVLDKGKCYELIDKKERAFSPLERLGRGALGLSAVIYTLGLALLSKSIRNLFTKQKETLYFGTLYQSAQELEGTIEISDEIKDQLAKSMKAILRNHNCDGVKNHATGATHRIFTLDSQPQLIFKMIVSQDTSQQTSQKNMSHTYSKWVQAQKVIRVYQLTHLVLPHAKLISIQVGDQQYEMIAEEKFNLKPHHLSREITHEPYAKSVQKAKEQVDLFITQMGYLFGNGLHLPVLDPVDAEGNRKIALINTQYLTDWIK